MMRSALRTIALATAVSAIAFAVQAANPMAGGAPTFPTKNHRKRRQLEGPHLVAR
ncbi:hypothetical protein [Rhizobium azibense]|nr:hypothetical protein [Rhizobium azibense]TCU38496.1 hypothetical protein EV129_104100 [Rhizobium azibense]